MWSCFDHILCKDLREEIQHTIVLKMIQQIILHVNAKTN